MLCWRFQAVLHISLLDFTLFSCYLFINSLLRPKNSEEEMFRGKQRELLKKKKTTKKKKSNWGGGAWPLGRERSCTEAIFGSRCLLLRPALPRMALPPPSTLAATSPFVLFQRIPTVWPKTLNRPNYCTTSQLNCFNFQNHCQCRLLQNTLTFRIKFILFHIGKVFLFLGYYLEIVILIAIGNTDRHSGWQPTPPWSPKEVYGHMIMMTMMMTMNLVI